MATMDEMTEEELELQAVREGGQSYEREERQRVIEIARSYLGTKYHDNAKVKGTPENGGGGVDCATLIAMVFEEAGLTPPVEIPPYSPQWFLHRNEEKYMDMVMARAHEISSDDAQPADVILYKLGRVYAHGGIIVSFPDQLIHAYKAAGKVVLAQCFEGEMLSHIVKGVIMPREFKIFTRW